MASKTSENLPLKYALHANLTIAGEPFRAAFINSNLGIEVSAAWLNKGGALSVDGLARHFDINLPDFLNWEIAINSASVRYVEKNNSASFKIVFSDSKVLDIASEKPEPDGYRTYELSFDANIFLPFADIPILGKLLGAGDGIELSGFSVEYGKLRELVLKLDIKLTLGGNSYPLHLEFKKTAAAYNALALSNAAENDGVKWIEINKSFKIVNIYRLGFSLADGLLSIYLDAAFSLAVLRMDFCGLYFSARLPRASDVSFGLRGLLVSFSKPPLSISGGFYKAHDENLYNGTLKVGFSSLTLTALGSYGELPDGEASVFIYLMLDYPIGGPPFFFVTGIAAGFGINRKFTVPELQDIRSFPFVSAALKEPGALSPKSTPSQALSKLSEWIAPSAGSYFVTAGVAFKSFNMFNSFALLTIAFGNKTQISLLGVSTVSMPPDAKGGGGKDPIAYAQLNLRAVYDPDEGSLEIVAALTNESYILDKKCKLTGGFAFCVWGKGKYAGDFVITLGGCHHPRFNNTHYPAVDKLGVNWQINSNLSLKGGGYFALTPSCLMAGANLDLTYSAGDLKAWLYADMAFLLQWKPFFYDISLYVALGASYRCFLLLGYKTFKLEMSASLHIWGPEFSGTARISWAIISFTISFGADAQAPKALGFDEFADSFLLKEATRRSGFSESENRSLFDIQISGGVLREVKEKSIMLVESGGLNIVTKCEIPSTRLSFNAKKVEIYSGSLGAVPMDYRNLSSTHIITVTDEKGRFSDAFDYEIITRNIESALWYDGKPDLNQGVIPNVPVGISIKPKSQKLPEGTLPPNGGAYSLETLLGHEPAKPQYFSWANVSRPDNVLKPGGDVYSAIKSSFGKNDKRAKALAELSKAFKTNKDMVVGEIGKTPEAYFLARPVLCTTGSKARKGEDG